MSDDWSPYGETITIGRDHLLMVNFFTPTTDLCVVCQKPAIGLIVGMKVCSIKCAKHIVYDDFEKLVDSLQ